MNREEAFEVLNFEVEEAKMVCLEDYYDASEKEQAGAFIRAVERLKQPLTLAEFLGWEEGVEYRRGGNILKVEGNHLLDKRPNGKFYNANCSTAELIDLRNATKYELKYYAKVKGWELMKNSEFLYWNYYKKNDVVFIGNSVNSVNTDTYKTIFTIEEWNELGINDTNADFEEVEPEC